MSNNKISLLYRITPKKEFPKTAFSVLGNFCLLLLVVFELQELPAIISL